MPALKNARREKLAQALAKGMSATDALAEAGYSDPRNSTRLTKNDEVAARVAELQTKVVEKVISAVSFDAADMFRELANDIRLAQQAGDHKAAIDGRKFMLRAFGYEDHPTLTHEHVRQSKIEVGAPKAPQEPDKPGEQAPEPANMNRFGEALKRYAGGGAKK